MKRNLVLVLPLVALLGAGCSSTRNAASTESAPATTVESKAAATADTGAVASAGVVGDDASADVGLPPELVNKRVIYFAFDSSEVRAEDRALTLGMIEHALRRDLCVAQPPLRFHRNQLLGNLIHPFRPGRRTVYRTVQVLDHHRRNRQFAVGKADFDAHALPRAPLPPRFREADAGRH